jgi:outer membrane protein OmpA-like peptidoglycan-associated protein
VVDPATRRRSNGARVAALRSEQGAGWASARERVLRFDWEHAVAPRARAARRASGPGRSPEPLAPEQTGLTCPASGVSIRGRGRRAACSVSDFPASAAQEKEDEGSITRGWAFALILARRSGASAVVGARRHRFLRRRREDIQITTSRRRSRCRAGRDRGIRPPTIRLPIFFEFNSAQLRPEASQLLDKVSAALASGELETFRFSIEGHTDSIGSPGYNASLSAERAAAVQNYLLAKGVPRSRLGTIGHGAAAPVASNDTEEGRQRNRRVEIINLGATQ